MINEKDMKNIIAKAMSSMLTDLSEFGLDEESDIKISLECDGKKLELK